MRVDTLDLHRIPQLSSLDRHYSMQDTSLNRFIVEFPNPASVRKKALARTFDSSKRETLVNNLSDQHIRYGAHSNALEQIALLHKENTFTVTTAHQPCLFTGPPYIIYKIVSVISACQHLNQQNTDLHFVPVFWNGGEDHDFEEINHCHLGSKKYTWYNDQQGSVNDMTTDGIEELLNELADENPWFKATDFYTILHDVYSSDKEEYGLRFNQLICKLFSEYGLLVIDPSLPAFKEQFRSVMLDDLLKNSSQSLVMQTQEELKELNFPKQAHARKINIFYKEKGIRERIYLTEDNIYQVNNQTICFSQEEIIAKMEQSPASFSPNVILRPLYQESILPNVAYIGGGGELAYWLERKRQFENYNIDFPILIRRCSAVVIDVSTREKMDQFGFDHEKWFLPVDQLIHHFLDHGANRVKLEKEKEILRTLFHSVRQTFNTYKHDMDRAIIGAEKDMLKILDRLDGKLLKLEKQQHQSSIQELQEIKSTLFPDNKLQERHTHISYLLRKNLNDWIPYLINQMNPFDRLFYSIST